MPQRRRAQPRPAATAHGCCAIRPCAVGTPLPELTDSRMRASSSSARLRQPEGAIVGGDDAAVDLHEQRFEFVGQIAHGH